MILADVLQSARARHGPVGHHTHAIVLLVEYPRDPRPGEPGCDWIVGTQAQRAATLSAQTAVLLSTYLRMLGYEARSHSATCSDVDLGRLAVAAGLARTVRENGEVVLVNPYVGTRYGLAAVTTTLGLAPDAPLDGADWIARLRSHGPSWWLGKGTLKAAFNREAYSGLFGSSFGERDYRMGAFPFEKTGAPGRPHHLHRPRSRAALSQARRLLRARALRRHGQERAAGRQERPLRDEEPDRRLRQARAGRAPAAAVRRRAGAGGGEHRGPPAQRRQPEGRLVLPELRRGRPVRGAPLGLLLARRRRQSDARLPPQRGEHADRPGSRDDGGRERRRLDLGRAEHARLPAVLDAGRHRRGADPAARLVGARALGARRRRSAAAPAAALGTGRGEPDRRGDPQPLPGPAAEVRHGHHRHADGLRPADRLRPAALLRAMQQVRAGVPFGCDHRGPEADVQRLRDLEIRRGEMCPLPDHEPGRRHVRSLHEDVPVESRGSFRGERVPLDRDALSRERAPPRRARRPARSRLDQSREEVVVGHRTRPRQRPVRPRETDQRPRPEQVAGAQVRGADAGRLSGRQDAAALPGGIPGRPGRGDRALQGAAHAGGAQTARGGGRDRRPGAAVPASRRPAPRISGDPEAARGDDRGRREVRVRARRGRLAARVRTRSAHRRRRSHPNTCASTVSRAIRPTAAGTCSACFASRRGVAVRC